MLAMKFAPFPSDRRRSKTSSRPRFKRISQTVEFRVPRVACDNVDVAGARLLASLDSLRAGCTTNLVWAAAFVISSSYVQSRYTPLVPPPAFRWLSDSKRSSRVSSIEHSSENGDLPTLRHWLIASVCSYGICNETFKREKSSLDIPTAEESP